MVFIQGAIGVAFLVSGVTWRVTEKDAWRTATAWLGLAFFGVVALGGQ